MKLRKSKIQNIVFVYFIFILIGYTVYTVNTSYISDYLRQTPKGLMTVYFFIFILIFLYSISQIKILLKSDLFTLICVYLILVLIQLTNVVYEATFNEYVKSILFCTQWINFLLLGVIIGYYNQNIEKISAMLLICVLPFLMINLIKLYQESSNIIYWHNPDFFFSIIIFLPFILLLNNKIIKVLLIIISGIIAYISMKRSIIIGYTFAILIYLILQLTLSKKNILKQNTKKNQTFIILLLVIFAIIIFRQINTFVFKEMPITPLQRFEMINETGGSGRVDIYKTIWKNIYYGDFYHFLFGHGYKAVLKINDDMLAHNDLLEIFYDFGFLVLFVFILIAIKILSYGFKMLKRNDRLYFSQIISAFFAGYLLWIILGSLNCFIYSVVYFPIMALFFGIIIGFYHNPFRIKNMIDIQ
ncbi:MAG: hypothetical protein GYA62_14140 [Bacteroidales bacterium]|nr:hypothetical protein [Bacteroidales bacterium]